MKTLLAVLIFAAAVMASPVWATDGNKLYEAGESGMGYTLYGAVTQYGFIISCSVGKAVDWVKLPNGISVADIEDVIPHWGSKDIWGEASFRGEAAEFKWCLF